MGQDCNRDQFMILNKQTGSIVEGDTLEFKYECDAKVWLRDTKLFTEKDKEMMNVIKIIPNF